MEDALHRAAAVLAGRPPPASAMPPPFPPTQPKPRVRKDKLFGDATTFELHKALYKTGIDQNLALTPPTLEPPERAAPARLHQQVDAAPPSAQDLYALYRLCGGSAIEVVEFLARLWGENPAAIADVVFSWLVELPSVPPPPSRSRSAPPVLPPAIRQRLASAAPPTPLPKSLMPWERALAVRAGNVPGTRLVGRHAEIGPIAESAPVRGSAPMGLTSAIAGLHSASTRMNDSSGSAAHRRRTGDEIYTLPASNPTFSPVRLTAAQVATVPERANAADVVLGAGSGGGDEALADFMVRNAASCGKLSVSDLPAKMIYGSHRFRF